MTEIVFSNDMDEEMTLNMGPHHPSTHGVLRFVVETDGEIIRKAAPDVGFLHRSLEKIAEHTTYQGYMPFTDRIDYCAAMFPNEVWAMACEKLLDVEVPPRAQYLRAITGELNRISSHMIALGTMAMDIGAVTVFPWTIREREYVNDFIEELCGARLTHNYSRIGGVIYDMPKGWRDKVLDWIDKFMPAMAELNRLVTGNEIYVQRLGSVAVITGEEAIDFGLVGPNLRASGVDWDVRKGDGYGVYPKTEFDVVVGTGEKGTVGDCWDRFDVRCRESIESAKIVRQCFDQIDEWPEDEIQGTVPRKIKPEGEAYARVESARGDLGCYIVATGGAEPYRAHFRTGSFTSMSIVEAKSPGLFVADLVALIASLDVVAPEIDR